MVAVPKLKIQHCYTPEEYFEMDERSEVRLEYVDGEIVAMAGESLEHNDIASNICLEIKLQFRGRRCKVYMEGVRVRVSERQYRYPDVVALCGQPQTAGGRPRTLLNPSVIFEVLSDSTEDKDRGVKRREYERLPTMTDYLLVAQDTRHVRHYSRRNGTDWQEQTYTRDEDIIRLDTLAVTLTLADIYNEVTPEDILIEDDILEP